MRLFVLSINLDFITLFFFSIFLEIPEQLFLKAVKKLEVLSATIRKIHDLKKTSSG